MHIAVITTGSRGDTEPYVALGGALAEAGYTVTLGAPPNFEDMVRSRGLRYAPIAGDFNRLLAAEGERGAGLTGGTVRTALSVRRMVGPIIRQIGDDALAAAQNADAIVSALPLAAGDVAAHLGIPYIAASLFPFARTGAHAHPFFPPRTPRVLNRATFPLAEIAAWQMFAPALNRWRAQRFGAPPVGPRGPFRAQAAMTRLTLHAYSPRVVPPPDAPNLRVTGYWFTPPDPVWQPPAELVDFLAAGPPPVFVGFGSMPDPDPAATTALVVDALRQAGQRGVLHHGWAQLGAADLPGDVALIGETPYQWLFPQMAAVVHHGGAGTTGHAFRAGVPQVVVPHLAEQPFWAHRVALAGVGASVPRKRLTADRLAVAIRQVTGDPAVGARAVALGEAIRTEDGLGAAVEAIRAELEA